MLILDGNNINGCVNLWDKTKCQCMVLMHFPHLMRNDTVAGLCSAGQFCWDQDVDMESALSVAIKMLTWKVHQVLRWVLLLVCITNRANSQGGLIVTIVNSIKNHNPCKLCAQCTCVPDS